MKVIFIVPVVALLAVRINPDSRFSMVGRSHLLELAQYDQTFPIRGHATFHRMCTALHKNFEYDKNTYHSNFNVFFFSFFTGGMQR